MEQVNSRLFPSEHDTRLKTHLSRRSLTVTLPKATVRAATESGIKSSEEVTSSAAGLSLCISQVQKVNTINNFLNTVLQCHGLF